MYLELILPTIEELAKLKPGHKILDLGTGDGIVARRLSDAQKGVEVLACDVSEEQLEIARGSTEAWHNMKRAKGPVEEKKIRFESLDLIDRRELDKFAEHHQEYVPVDPSPPKLVLRPCARCISNTMITPREFDVITISMVLQELPDLKPLAKFLPKVLKPDGK